MTAAEHYEKVRKRAREAVEATRACRLAMEAAERDGISRTRLLDTMEKGQREA
jgi:hypothetical protein